MVQTAARHPGRLAAWLAFILILTSISYAGRFSDAETPNAYQWSAAVGIVIQFFLMLGVIFLITWGVPRREMLALRRPASWKRAAVLAIAVLVAIEVVLIVYTAGLSLFGDFNAGEEQGLVPDEWDSSRALPFAAFFIGATTLVPFIEELTYRGLGISLALPYGTVLAVALTGTLFGLTHGLLIALAPLVFFGLAVGWLRVQTDSVVPGMAVHASFNCIALIAAVASG